MASPSIDPWGYTGAVGDNGNTSVLQSEVEGSIPSLSTKSYWYEYFTDYCPVCARSDDYKIRVYDRPKPDTYEERHHFKETFDYCIY